MASEMKLSGKEIELLTGTYVDPQRIRDENLSEYQEEDLRMLRCGISWLKNTYPGVPLEVILFTPESGETPYASLIFADPAEPGQRFTLRVSEVDGDYVCEDNYDRKTDGIGAGAEGPDCTSEDIHQRLALDEYLLLEHLTYLVEVPPMQNILHFDGFTVKEVIDSIDLSALEDERIYGSYMTGKDWKNTFGALMRNPKLQDVLVTAPHLDEAPGSGGGVSTLLLRRDVKEVIVAFRGTGPNEWVDDFIGANTTDTPQQKNALEWYRQAIAEQGLADWYITVIGHSKGGNKAKYIAILDDTVNHCVAFDGQGFSDAFFTAYKERILNRQHMIENHNVDYDYVSILLNDVGPVTFYEGFDLGKGGFLENHCPNTYFDYAEDGMYRMQVAENGQSQEMKELDFFLNSYLRSMKEEDREESLLLVGNLIEGGFSMSHRNAAFDEYIRFFTSLILDERFTDDVAYLIAYLIKYNQKDPRMMEALRMVFGKFNMDGFIQTVNIIQDILDWNKFDAAFHMVELLTTRLPGPVLNIVLGKIKKKRDIDLEPDQLRALLSILSLVREQLPNVVVEEDGEDLRLETI